MKWFWISFFCFLGALVVSAAFARPDTVDATLAFTGAYLVALSWTLFATLVAGAIVGGGTVLFLVIRKNQINSLRQKDGHYPLQRVKLKTGQVIYFDPNVMVGVAVTIDRNSGTVMEHEPAAGWHVQATIRALVERTRSVQAMFQGDDSRASRFGALHRGDRVTAAAARMLEAPKRPLELPAAAEPAQLPPPPPAREWQALDALNLNTRTKLVLGQDAAGELIRWDLSETPHLRFHGVPQGSGKTNAIKTAAAGAVKTGAHVIVLDRRRFKDWRDFRNCAELVDAKDPKAFVAAVSKLRDIYQERDAMLGQAGAPNIASLDNAPPRIVVVISEFGALCATAQADGVLDDVLYPLQLILREAGATGIHVLIEDQVVDERWPRGVSATTEPVSGRQPQNYGAAGGYHHAHQLAPYQFHYAGRTFRTFDMRAALPVALAGYGRTGPNLVDAVAPVRERVSANVSEVFPGVSTPVDPPPQPTGNTGNAADNGKWYDFILAYMLTQEGRGLWQSPARGVRDLARAMSRHDTGNETAEDNYVGIASKLAAGIRAETHLPGGERLGTDTATTVAAG